MGSTKPRRARRRHLQQELFRHGGKRRGAGRKPNGPRAGENHDARPEFKRHHALHVVMRVMPAVGSLRRRKLYQAMRYATILFPDWEELEGQPWMWPLRETYDPLVVRRPTTWLLREGWRRGGGPISARDVPSKAR